MNHLRANAVAYVALFLALGGGTAVAVSGALKAETVDGLSAAKFRQQDSQAVAPTKVLGLSGMRVRYSCSPGAGARGSSAGLELDLRTLNDDATVTLGFTTGSDPGGSAFVVKDLDLDAGEGLDLDQGRSFGAGHATYSLADGRVITLDYGFDEGATTCLAHGVALGG